MQVKLDDFTAVKKDIDVMVDDLLKQKDQEIKHKDMCLEELSTKERETAQAEREKEDTTAHLAELEQASKTLAEEIAALEKEISEMQTAMQRAGEDRELHN